MRRRLSVIEAVVIDLIIAEVHRRRADLRWTIILRALISGPRPGWLWARNGLWLMLMAHELLHRRRLVIIIIIFIFDHDWGCRRITSVIFLELDKLSLVLVYMLAVFTFPLSKFGGYLRLYSVSRSDLAGHVN